MKKSKQQKERDIIKCHDLVLTKLNKIMMSIEDSKEWKKVCDQHNFTLVVSWVIEECLLRWLDKSCIHTVKDSLNTHLQNITAHKVIQAKADREEAHL